ncbi:zinc finger protein neuro-d4-like [Parus major]|uniref:zinc finger protein neuro-d4-like n=1 Tax=Parus major TaxID=9157 RepID=UPI0007710EBA|nr:zinc finger protein neuro-d4-like [Parus major]
MATALHKPLKCLGEEFYREALEHCRSYNSRLCAERSLRLPFLDAQTGVAQSNSYIWMERAHRRPGLSPGQIYSYPARCWRKKRRLNILEAPRLRPYCEAPLRKEGALPEGPVLEALLCAETPERKGGDGSKDEETALEGTKPPPPEFPHDPDGDELDDDPPRRKNKAKGKAYGMVMKRRVDAVLEERDKPYVCDSEWGRAQGVKIGFIVGQSGRYWAERLIVEQKFGEKFLDLGRKQYLSCYYTNVAAPEEV